MNAAMLDDTEVAAVGGITPKSLGGKQVDVTEFRRLAVSHRRMIRVDRPEEGLRGLQDLDTGETFFTPAHRLLAK
jgi:hypothetical protein